MTALRVCFEPWGMGDALIAAAVLREDPVESALACHPRWIPLLRSVMPASGSIDLLPVDLSYTTRSRESRLDAGSMAAVAFDGVRDVLSIRGDPRDRAAARRLFPGAQIRMTGWIPFLARRSRLIDLPFAAGLRPVRNRYIAWCHLMDVAYTRLALNYAGRRSGPTSSIRAAIHVGAQWRSRQYPHALELKGRLEEDGYGTTLIAGPGDLLPRSVNEDQVQRVRDEDLVGALKSVDLVICNDSGPMHLAAILGCRTVVMARISNIDEWLPPGVLAIRCRRMPRGYRPDRRYTTDEVVEGWPEPRETARSILDRTRE